MLDQPLRRDPGHEIVPCVDALAPVVAERKGQALVSSCVVAGRSGWSGMGKSLTGERPSRTWGWSRDAAVGTVGRPFGRDVIALERRVHNGGSDLEHQMRASR